MEGSWGEESILVPDIAGAIAVLEEQLAPGDLVLVKASQSIGLWEVADRVLTGSTGQQGSEATR
jgi:UDP-N-acetylmuramoyl-tripeptide--D-alanyl-D-alanine ligase